MNHEHKIEVSEQKINPTVVDTFTYDQLKISIRDSKELFSKENNNLKDQKSLNILRDYWISTFLNDLYPNWAKTPWDFNGTTEQPGVGYIACGYFVTTLLRDMDVKIQRVKLAICPSYQMMQTLVPSQKVINLSSVPYREFNERITKYGKGIYIIGLDFHTGFIINDGIENWFIHSNYIDRQGVIKETLLDSKALKSSKTRWIVSLTSDKEFLSNWLRS